MADKVAKMANRKMYGLVYSRGTAGRFKTYEIAKDDDLIIRSLPKETMSKVVGRRSKNIRYRAKDSLSEHFLDIVKGKEGTETITMKGEPQAVCSKQESQTGEGVPIGNGQIEVDIVQKEEKKDINIPMKRKRGADGEIVCAYLLSQQKSLSRLRPRNEVPAFRMVNLEANDNEFVVGKRVKVYWSGSRKWFTGRIVAFDNKNGLHRILYEDGDKEVLDLRKERFELEVMPTDHFKLQSEHYSARKADGFDTGNVREALMKENSRSVSGAKTMTKNSKSKQKKEAKKGGKRTSLKALRTDTEAIIEDLVSNGEVIPNNVGELVTNKVSDMEEPGKASSEEDECNFFSEATMEFEAEATVVKSHSEFWSMGSDNSSIKEIGNFVEDDSLKVSIAELAKKVKGSSKRFMPKAKRMRTNKAFSREFSNVVEKLEADMKTHVHCDKVKTTRMDVDINSEAMDISYQNISRKNEALEKKASEECETSNEAPFTTLDLISKKKTAVGSDDVSRNAANEVEKLTKTENRIAEDVIASPLLNPHNFKDEREDLTTQMEFATCIKKAEDELITAMTTVQRPGDFYSVNTYHEAESILEAENMKPCEESCHLQPVVQISPEEAQPTVSWEKSNWRMVNLIKNPKKAWSSSARKHRSTVASKAKSNDGAAI